MNILPHKSWHVRTKANIARVRRDEANAAEEERIKQARIQKAETETRINILRHQARSKYDGRAETDNTSEKLEHVNFFAELEEGKIDYNRPNKEHEREKKEEKEKYEKQIGYLTYLGQDTNEATGKKNWYEELPKRLTDTEKDIEVGIRKKVLDDPMIDMRKYLNIMRSKPEDCSKIKIESVRKRCDSDNSHSDQESHRTLKKCKKDKKHKKHKRSKESERKEAKNQNNINIEKLRVERMLREQSEKLRTEALLAKVKGEPVGVIPETPKPTIRQKYNSQYFPELARQNAERTPKHMYNLDKM
ncbi:leukocyte receptor cluster member 1 homolog [Pseudomyrmex gracilis]|uniref:leukocyte receptor cluster member 1 homolog n=1 Tax=Pseudomyrmex gracilis TaxID=219809 RepID=UPI000994CA01|nr:leukocyte receptor cluster member 1 homolog [Pseudomyrmex gracilis]